MKASEEIRGKAAKVSMLVMDVDGTMTDGCINIGPHGELFKSFSAKDGLGISLWHAAGRKSAIITGRNSAIVTHRAEELGITCVCQGVQDKRVAWLQIKETYGLSDEQMAYVGDDLNDLPALRLAGLACCPADAHPTVKEMAHFVAPHAGGAGAIRDVVELLMKSQNIEW